MFSRKAAVPLLKRLRLASRYASFFSSSATTSGHCSKTTFFSYYGSKNFQTQPRSISWMMFYGQAALLVGCYNTPVFAEEISSEVTCEGSAGESNDIGRQRVEDGSVVSNEHTSKWRIFTDKGREFFLQGKLKEAEKLFSSALAEAKKGFGERDPHVASACNNLAELYRVKKTYDKAEPLYLDAIRILEESFGPNDVRVGAALHNLGQFYILQRKFEEAKVCYERALKIKGRVLGLGHADYADTMFHLGTVLYLQGNIKDAEVLIQDSIRILEDGGQGETKTCIRKLRFLAQIYSNSNRLQDAANVRRKILHIMELTKGWDSMDTVISAESLSMTLQFTGKLRDARELLEKCLDIRRRLLPEDHIQVAANMLRLANVVLLDFKQIGESTTAEANVELDRAKELLMNSIRIACGLLDGIKLKKNFRNYEQPSGKLELTALGVLLKSLKTLAHLEMARQEKQESKETLSLFEAEKALRQCISSFKQYGSERSASSSMEVRSEYLSCLRDLVNIITVTMMKKEQLSQLAELEKLEDEIRRVDAELSSRRKHKM